MREITRFYHAVSPDHGTATSRIFGYRGTQGCIMNKAEEDFTWLCQYLPTAYRHLLLDVPYHIE